MANVTRRNPAHPNLKGTGIKLEGDLETTNWRWTYKNFNSCWFNDRYTAELDATRNYKRVMREQDQPCM